MLLVLDVLALNGYYSRAIFFFVMQRVSTKLRSEHLSYAQGEEYRRILSYICTIFMGIIIKSGST